MALQEGRRRDPLSTLLLGAQVVKERRASWWADVLVVGRPERGDQGMDASLRPGQQRLRCSASRLFHGETATNRCALL